METRINRQHIDFREKSCRRLIFKLHATAVTDLCAMGVRFVRQVALAWRRTVGGSAGVSVGIDEGLTLAR